VNVFNKLRRHCFEPIYAIYSSSPLLSYWKMLEQSQYLPESELRERQYLKLKNLIEFAWKNNNYYRTRFEEAGLIPNKFFSLDDFLKIPVLTKDEIKINTLNMISQGYEIKKLMNFKTGGSTGKSLDIYLTEECSELRNACARRHDRWSGWEVGEPIAAVWGNPHIPVNTKDKLKQWLLSPTIYLDTLCVNEESVLAFSFNWDKVKPTLLFGHAHSIYIFAQYVRDLNLTNIKPNGILSTSMMLVPHERNVIEEVFGVKVTNRYGCEEVSLIASECEYHEGMHLNIEHLFIEFVKEDGTPTVPGEPGKIVITDLMNRAMPFIRYQVEDVGVPSDRKCSCGRGMPLMESVTGRVADFLVKRDGSKVAGVSLIENTLTKILGIKQMQIVQESIDLIVLRVVPGRDYLENSKFELVDYFEKLFGKSVSIDVKIVETIQPEASGKYRFSICRISH
jgi:phenylacetate-CoA ligase